MKEYPKCQNTVRDRVNRKKKVCKKENGRDAGIIKRQSTKLCMCTGPVRRRRVVDVFDDRDEKGGKGNQLKTIDHDLRAL